MPVVDPGSQNLSVSGISLDEGPPQPPLAAAPRTPGIGGPESSMGPPMQGGPQVEAIGLLQEIEQATQKLGQGVGGLIRLLPGLSPMMLESVEGLREMVEGLRATVPQALSEMAGGGMSMPTGAGPSTPGMPPGPLPIP